jgi:hypothetical protein
MPQTCLAGSDALQMQYQQHLQPQQQRQQYLQQQQLAQGGFGTGASGLLAPSVSVGLATPLSSVLGACPSPSLGPVGGVGALSGSFAFGAPYSSSFSPAPYSARGASSLGGADVLGRTGVGGMSAPGSRGPLEASLIGDGMGNSGDGLGLGSGGSGVRGRIGSASRPELLLPDDLNFSPPTSAPHWPQD